MGKQKARQKMVYIILALTVLSIGFIAIMPCMFSSMLSREEEQRMLLHDDPLINLSRV